MSHKVLINNIMREVVRNRHFIFIDLYNNKMEYGVDCETHVRITYFYELDIKHRCIFLIYSKHNIPFNKFKKLLEFLVLFLCSCTTLKSLNICSECLFK